jgi:hypothetical protein
MRRAAWWLTLAAVSVGSLLALVVEEVKVGRDSGVAGEAARP